MARVRYVFNFVHPYIKNSNQSHVKTKTKTHEGREQKAVGLNYFSSSSMREFGASSTHHWESFNGYEGNEAIKSESFIKIYWAR